ncbi:MAG: helix-turn-helix domain-containing protein [Myxococcales bacterium]|nr:helix-turn-helix domain-containing protein [Myxococcales bacterium]
MRHRAMLRTVGARVRALRDERSLSRKELSRLSGVSERFLAQLESGQGNISLSRLADVCDALTTTPAAILAGASVVGQHGVIALLGVRGAGKSSVGAQLATRRSVAFVEIDELIENAAGLSLSEIFEMHGEDYYRKLEYESLRVTLTDNRPVVVATGGSIVNHQENFALIQGSACTVWLRARPQDHWNRVIEQGDERPMAENPHAYSELKTLLATRERLYASANFVVDTGDKNIEQVVLSVAEALDPTLASQQ